ncbi:MAG TPA: YfhO family protein, partial [Flavisolibacter sp.]|nr:YfhO family protein [Flavisolibacter sp.]
LGLGYALPSYFHKTIGGYHPAKLSIYQDLIEHQLSKFPQSLHIVNMLDTKYIIQKDQSGQDQVYTNPDALGAAWFVQGLKYETTPAAVMNALTSFNPKDTAILFTADKNLVSTAAQRDSSANIRLIKNDNDIVTYQSNATSNGFAVFSEVFYDKGWKAYIDGKETPIIRTNYVLRGLSVPAGQHEIRFVFHPASYYLGDTIGLISGLVVLGFLILALLLEFRKRRVA